MEWFWNLIPAAKPKLHNPDYTLKTRAYDIAKSAYEEFNKAYEDHRIICSCASLSLVMEKYILAERAYDQFLQTPFRK